MLAAVSSLNRLACVIEAMRHALSALAVAAPAWLAAHAQRHWAESYEPRGLAERQTRAAPERRALAIGVGADGHDLLSAVHSADAPVWLRQVSAVETCPRGAVSASWTLAVDNRATAVVNVKFSRRDCKTCADRAVCAGPLANRRLMILRPQSEYEALKTERRRQETSTFAALYAWRAGVEATMSWAVRGFGLRRARYIGRAKVHLQHLAIAAALNMMRLTRWIVGLPIAGTRSSPLAHLFHQTSPA